MKNSINKKKKKIRAEKQTDQREKFFMAFQLKTLKEKRFQSHHIIDLDTYARVVPNIQSPK